MVGLLDEKESWCIYAVLCDSYYQWHILLCVCECVVSYKCSVV